MGIAKVKIENFRTIDRMNLDVKESGISYPKLIWI